MRIRHWVSFHGLSINVEPDLSHYAGIVPCGIAEHGVTSLVDLGLPVTLADLDVALAETFDEVFGEPSSESLSIVLRKRGLSWRIGMRPFARSGCSASSASAAVGSCVKPCGRTSRSTGSMSMSSTRAMGGPRRQASIISPTASSSPTISASTAPSRAVAHPAGQAEALRRSSIAQSR